MNHKQGHRNSGQEPSTTAEKDLLEPCGAIQAEPEHAEEPAPSFKIRRAIYPVIIGLGVVAYLFWKDFNPEIFDDIDFRLSSYFWLLLALVFMFGRDFGYMMRLRTLSGGQLSWRQCFRVIMLWEFTSAVTPSAVGGTSFAILYVHKEGISVGRSSSIVMLTSFLDELYFIIIFPLIFLIFGKERLFDTSGGEGVLETGLLAFALVAYLLKLVYLGILSYGLFINPRGLKWLLMKIFRLSLLRRWYRDMNKVGTDIINSSTEIRAKGGRFWGSVFASTFLSWTSRYLVANAIVMAFFAVSDHFLLFARQLVTWIVMLVMPTPGGSGFAEYIFTNYCSDLMDVPLELQLSAAALIAFIWRGVTYYPYLLVGVLIFPRWVAKKFGKKNPKTKS